MELQSDNTTDMTSSEKFCLKWNDFQENIASSFHGLRDDLDFCDVTLICEEYKQIEAHRVILSAGSPFFSYVLKKNKHSHPVIYMRGLKSKDLIAIVDFIYHGEANINQEDLDSFLVIAEELQLKGLEGSNEEREDDNNIQVNEAIHPKHKIIPKQEITLDTDILEEKLEDYNTIAIHQSIIQSKKLAGLISFDSKNEELEAKISSMVESINDGEYRYRCSVCGKLGKNRQATSRHVESHLEGVSHPCSICGKVSSSRGALRVHIQSYHRSRGRWAVE